MWGFNAICNECDHKFAIRIGPTDLAWFLHCEKCGAERSIQRDIAEEITESKLTDEDWESILNQELTQEERAAIEKSNAVIENKAGQRSCGGRYTLNAPPRCPRCGSVDYHNADGMFDLAD